MIIEDVGMLAVFSNRTKFYLLQMIKQQLLPSFVIYMSNSFNVVPEKKSISGGSGFNTEELLAYQGFDLSSSVPDLLKDHNIPYKVVPVCNPNSKEVVEAISELNQSIIIYSGSGGAILRKNILNIGKRFLHIHSGILPQYRGSTTLYYSLINEGTCGATALFLDEEIDTGPVVRKRYFQAPEERTLIDLYYDPFIRSELLIEVLRYYTENGDFPVESQESKDGETYFIIHPVLKHIAIGRSNG